MGALNQSDCFAAAPSLRSVSGVSQRRVPQGMGHALRLGVFVIVRRNAVAAKQFEDAHHCAKEIRSCTPARVFVTGAVVAILGIVLFCSKYSLRFTRLLST